MFAPSRVVVSRDCEAIIADPRTGTFLELQQFRDGHRKEAWSMSVPLLGEF